MSKRNGLKRIVALAISFAMVFSLFTAFPVFASEAIYELGDFSIIDGWSKLWFTSEVDDEGDFPLTIEVFRASTHLVVELSAEPENDVEFLFMGDGNGWSWTQESVFGPEEGTTFTVNLREQDPWEAMQTGEALKFGFGSGGLEDVFVRAYLIYNPEELVVLMSDSIADDNLVLVLDNTTYALNGVAGTLDVAPVSVDGRTMVPLRFIGESLGAAFDWDDATKTVTFTKDGVATSVTVDVPLPNDMGTPVIVEGRTLVPVRYVSTALGAEVIWDAATRTVVVTWGEEEVEVDIPEDIEEPGDEDDEDPGDEDEDPGDEDDEEPGEPIGGVTEGDWSLVIGSPLFGRRNATLTATDDGIAVSNRGETNDGFAIDLVGLRELAEGDIVITMSATNSMTAVGMAPSADLESVTSGGYEVLTITSDMALHRMLLVWPQPTGWENAVEAGTDGSDGDWLWDSGWGQGSNDMIRNSGIPMTNSGAIVIHSEGTEDYTVVGITVGGVSIFDILD